MATSDRPQRLLGHVRDPEEPHGFAVLIGNYTKSLLLTAMCPGSRPPSNARHHGEVHLHVSHARITQPVFLAEGDLPVHNRLPSAPKSYRCHEIDEDCLLADVHQAAQAANEVYQRFLFPFVDVTCLFVADIGRPDRAIECLASWAATEPSSTSPIRPVLLVVVPREHNQRMRGELARMSQQAGPASLTRLFQSIVIVTFSPTQRRMWQRKQLGTLRRKVHEAICVVHRERRDKSFLFSARHTVAFL